MIKLEGVNKEFPEFKLNNINLVVEKGKITGLVGKNGSGKTTIINLITGIYTEDSGIVLIDGKEIKSNKKELLERLYVIFDEAELIDVFKPKDYDLMMRGLYSRWDSCLFKKFLEIFELPKSKAVGTYSKGMKVKFNFSLAFATHPEILILDESTSGLDPFMRSYILETVEKYVMENNTTVLFSSHIISDMEKIADNIIFIDNGEIQLMDSQNNLKNNYAYINDSEEFMRKYGDSDEDIIFKNGVVLVKDKSRFIDKYPEIEIMEVGLEDLILFIGNHKDIGQEEI